MLGGQDGGDMVAGTTAGCKPAAPTVRTTQKTKLSMYACTITRVECIFVYVYVHTHVHTYIHMYIRTYTHTGVHTYIRMPSNLNTVEPLKVDSPKHAHSTVTNLSKEDRV